MNSVIIDVVECILNEMIAFKEKTPSKANMPFVAMISSLCATAKASFLSDHLILPLIGSITLTSIKKSIAMSRTQSYPLHKVLTLLRPPKHL